MSEAIDKLHPELTRLFCDLYTASWRACSGDKPDPRRMRELRQVCNQIKLWIHKAEAAVDAEQAQLRLPFQLARSH